MSDHDTPVCILQERAYSDGWRDYALRRTAGGAAGTDNRFYRMGWADHMLRDQRPAMYARRESK